MVKVRRWLTTIMVWVVALSVVMAGVLYWSAERANAGDFHVTTAAGFQSALFEADENGQDDTIWLAAGTYTGNFEYNPQDGMSLTIKGEPGTTAEDVILDGGGSGEVLYLSGSSGGDSVYIEGLTIQNGGESGLFVSFENESLDITLSEVVIQNNSNEYRGGGIHLKLLGDSDLNVWIWNSVIRHNQSPGFTNGTQGRGGGIYAASVYGNNTIDLFIVNSLIYENEANWTGGGIDLMAAEVYDNNVTRAVLVNSTITGNVSDMHDTGYDPGGGIRVAAYGGNGALASLDLYNTIVYGNSSLGGEEGGQDLYVRQSLPGDATVNASYCDIGDVDADTGTYSPISVLAADPAFVDPSSDDYHLSGGSPCIDAGTAAVPSPPGLPFTDIEGNPRNTGTAPDMGAYESAGTVTPAIGFSPASLVFTAAEGGPNPANQNLELWNSGAGTLNWSVSDDAAWLGLSPPNGSSTGEHDSVTVSVDISGLSPGGYSGSITISDPLASNTPRTVPVSLTVYAPGPTVSWDCPFGGVSLIAPYPINGRPYLSEAANPFEITVSAGAELWGIYYLDEATGEWAFFNERLRAGANSTLELALGACC